MHYELTNLLPFDRRRAIRREYFVRLATVFTCGLIAVVIGSGALLVPSYLYLNQEIHLREARLADLDSRLASSQGQQANLRLNTLSENSTYLSRLATTSSATPALRAVIELPHSGITLSGFSYTPVQRGTDGRMILTGTASTRETLRAYVQALGQLPFVSNADLPISAYAKESAIPFTITLTGSLQP